MWTIIFIILLVFAGYMLWDKSIKGMFVASGIRPPGYIIPAGSPMVSLEMRRKGGACAPIARSPRKFSGEDVREGSSKPAPATVHGPSTSGETAAVSGNTDDLTRIKGIGAVTAEQLAALGVSRYAQLAAMTEDELNALDLSVRNRETWIKQAKALIG